MSARAPLSAARSPPIAVAVFSADITSFSASVRSCMAPAMEVVGSAKLTVVGAPMLAAFNCSFTPGMASDTVLDFAVICSPSILKAASLALARSWPLVEEGFQARSERPEVVSSTKPLAAPSCPLSTSWAPSTVWAT